MKPQLMDRQTRDKIHHLFGQHISKGQVRYLRCGHLDTIERNRKNSRFIDAFSGRMYYDAFTSAGCFNVGRMNEHIIRALDDALDKYDMGSAGFSSAPKAELINRLSELAPGDLKNVILCASGGDACACAMKLARAATGRNEIITMIKAYHGHEGFSLSGNGKDYYKHLFVPLMPGFRLAPFNDLQAVQKIASSETAAIVIEPVQGEAGIYVSTPDFISGLRELCDKLGILLVFDEVQTGVGRTGKLWASQHYGVLPDIMFIAKSLSGGLYPNAAVLFRKDGLPARYAAKNPSFHRSFSGGSDLGCMVSIGVLDFVTSNRLWENSARMGKYFKDGLIKLQDENPSIIKELRGLGLMIGIEYQYEFVGALMSDSLSRQGVWAVFSSNAPHVMRFQLPLTVTQEEIDDILNKIRLAVKRLRKYLVVMLPLSRIQFIRRLLDNVHLQIITLNFTRDIEEFIAGIFRKKDK
jgi:acetylornithine/succinyldiaminopimelate/putrescine aminotransferase